MSNLLINLWATLDSLPLSPNNCAYWSLEQHVGSTPVPIHCSHTALWVNSHHNWEKKLSMIAGRLLPVGTYWREERGLNESCDYALGCLA